MSAGLIQPLFSIAVLPSGDAKCRIYSWRRLVLGLVVVPEGFLRLTKAVFAQMMDGWFSPILHAVGFGPVAVWQIAWFY